ncbi:MAG: hypothetical protein NT166_12890 [Candidatus Aminicenantes bacterium]|nr:hypothetical protein [Candidatus Aminicenantes bacterium]
MKKIWHIAFIDIKRMVRDKTYFFWTLLFPLVFIFIFGSIFRGDTQPTVAALVVVNRDAGPWGAYFIEKSKRRASMSRPPPRWKPKSSRLLSWLLRANCFSI